VDLIISDMRMPGMDGATFLAEARRATRTPCACC
jgi:CheY-like chemotaxis protein